MSGVICEGWKTYYSGTRNLDIQCPSSLRSSRKRRLTCSEGTACFAAAHAILVHTIRGDMLDLRRLYSSQRQFHPSTLNVKQFHSDITVGLGNETKNSLERRKDVVGFGGARVGISRKSLALSPHMLVARELQFCAVGLRGLAEPVATFCLF